MARYWLAYEITGSAWALGILGFCEAAPRLLLGAVGGVIVDRYDRLRLLTGIQILCCIPVFVLIFLYFAGILVFWHMVALENALGTIRSMNPTAGQSVLRDLVPESELMSAVSLYSIGFNFARIVGPSLGGVLSLWIGVGGCLVFYGVSLIISAGELLGVRLRPSAPASSAGNFVTSLKRASATSARRRRSSQAFWRPTSSASLSGPTPGSSPSLPKTFSPSVRMDWACSWPPRVWVRRIADHFGHVGRTVEPKSFALVYRDGHTAVAHSLLSFSQTLVVGLTARCFRGGMQIIFRTVSRLIIQVEAPRELLGRVMGVFLMDQGMRSAGSMVMGAFVVLFGAAHGLAFTSAISITLPALTFGRLLGKRNE